MGYRSVVSVVSAVDSVASTSVATSSVEADRWNRYRP